MSDAESTYRQFGRLIETMPAFSGIGPLNVEQLTWIGRASALLAASNQMILWAEFEASSKHLSGPRRQLMAGQIQMTLHKALATAELQAPPGARGAFIPAGNAFDAFAAVTKVLQTAKSDLLIVDPYMDETVLTEFAGSVLDGIPIRLLADAASVKISLKPAAASWVKQYPNKPLSVRLAPAKALHDRAIFVDGTTGWILTQSLKDFAKRSPAEIVRADDTAPLKISAYEAIWTQAAIVV